MCVNSYICVFSTLEADVSPQYALYNLGYKTVFKLWCLKAINGVRISMLSPDECMLAEQHWLLFIVHSFIRRASCLAWYSVILQPTFSFSAIPWRARWPQVHNSDCATHWIHSDLRYCFSEPHLCLFASPADTEVLSRNCKWLFLYVVMKSHHQHRKMP